ncbi:NAD-dependent epimerase/dehydratase family protein [Nitratireductor sp. L1-7-SE]|uniref:NAD-dependent epimerase/dehydratase family protein n=1 Tax=Nitratireductor rhodophyticola TaxID=2854036 RepID=A0ABS7RD38_9HYPH|nr:NAD-dependent epimerase/dehydratase family protein [Nitratireductor rhodophyticola]MBY8918839.1 NAD-dependent epimerase/dehydratase family protein [Nitratireductor rhodophyticola]MBY8919978.1 NAD-dependent epimerase/dehydratase family protein [Nitratireductor rhodophyticola]
MTKKVLITGGAGFVGSNLSRYLTYKGGYDVEVLDNFFTGKRENLDGLDLKITKGSVADKEVVAECVKGKDIVFHLAARNVIVSNMHPIEDIETNIIGTYNVFDSCLRADVPRVVYSSTSSIYGNPQYLPVSENVSFQFLNNYSVSKYTGEAYAQCFWEREMLPISVVRYTNVYGFKQDLTNPYSGVVGKFIHWALRNEELKVHGDGYQTRDFTFIEDACEGTLMAALSPRAIGQVYNIGSGVETSVNQLADTIIQLCESRSNITHHERRDIDNIRRRVLNVEKARLELRHYPKFGLVEGLKATVEFERDLMDRGSSARKVV